MDITLTFTPRTTCYRAIYALANHAAGYRAIYALANHAAGYRAIFALADTLKTAQAHHTYYMATVLVFVKVQHVLPKARAYNPLPASLRNLQ